MNKWIVAMMMVWCSVAGASDHEIRNLTEVHKEIAILLELIAKMESETRVESGSRVTFRYDVLKERLREIQDGIRLHVDFVNDSGKLERFNVN